MSIPIAIYAPEVLSSAADLISEAGPQKMEYQRGVIELVARIIYPATFARDEAIDLAESRIGDYMREGR